jgi:hypothetical protein
MIGKASLHGWRDAQRFVNPAEIVVYAVERDCGSVGADLLAETVRQSREAAHAQLHTQERLMDRPALW